MDYTLHIIAVIGFSLPWALSYNLIFGRGKILHFGHEAVSIVAAYGAFLALRSTGSYGVALASGLLSTLGISVLFAWLALRLEADAFGILSIAMHAAATAVVLNWASLTRGALGIPHIPRMPGLESLGAFAVASSVTGILWVTIFWFLDRSRLGRALSALADNRHHAEALGISRKVVYVLAFIVAGIAILWAQVLYTQYVGLLHPSDFRFEFLVLAIMIVVAGGPGSVLGVSLSTALLICLKEGLRFLPLPLGVLGPLRVLLFGVILIVAVYLRRNELFPKPRTV